MRKQSAANDKVSLAAAAEKTFVAPNLPYRPRAPRRPRTKLALVGCGGISFHHLTAAKSFGVDVVALCDVNPEAARRRRDEFYPQAEIYTDLDALLARDDVTAVDLATHPHVRAGQIEQALRAGKHVLSQKPFVLDLAVGQRLVDLADRQGRVLAVNQNGRWAPYFAWLLAALRRGLLGDLHTLDLLCTWDHRWTKGTEFEKIHHLVLYDFAIHWFDIAANAFAGRAARSVFARAVSPPASDIAPPALAHAAVEFDHGLATLSFSAHAAYGPRETFNAVGSAGTLRGDGPICGIPAVHLHTKRGHATVPLEGSWFPDGFRGTLGEFLRAIEENREPSHSARGNLRSLEICFAALKSADTGKAVKPGTATKAAH